MRDAYKGHQEQPAGFIADLITPGYGSYFHEIIAVGDRQGDIEGKGVQKQINAQAKSVECHHLFTSQMFTRSKWHPKG